MNTCINCYSDAVARARPSIDAATVDGKMHTQVGSGWAPEDPRITHTRPRPGRRRLLLSSTAVPSILSIIVLLAAVCTPSLAVAVPALEGQAPPLPPVPGNPGFRPPWQSIGDTSDEIIFHHSQAHASDRYLKAEIHVRQLDLGSSTSSENAKATSSAVQKASGASSKATAASATETSSATSTDSGSSESSISSSTNSPLPKPFDAGLGTNFTQQTCPDFLTNMISNTGFTACLPFSLLLQNSMSFFDASRSLPTIKQSLDASCNVITTTCSSLMAQYALSLRSPSYCSDDYNRQNPIVRQAYNGLLSYDVLYRASCEHAQPTASNNQSSAYCFANAVTNTSDPSDSYIYYLPLGIPLPAGTQPACDQCLKSVMADFQAQAGNQSQPISLTYTQGAQLVNQQCGPNFVNQSAPTSSGGNSKSTSAAAPNAAVSGWLGTAVVLIGAAWLLF